VALPNLDVGMVFARSYRVVRRISAGGMGAVYEVVRADGQRAALKIMAPELVDSPEARTRFLGEATAAAAVHNPHVVEVYAAGVDDATSTPFIAMEYLEGDDLGQVLRRHGALPREAVVEIIRQLCRGLGAAHRAGLVHRDLKPQNVFLARTTWGAAGTAFVVKVLDFGIAKFLNDRHTSVQATSTLGTPLWMAPEQAEQGILRPSTDVWALGLLVFFMLTGRPYWRSANLREYNPAFVLRELVADPLEPGSVRAATLGRADRLPPGFDAWLGRCLHRDPTARFRDATEALGPFLALFGAAPEAPSGTATARAVALRTEPIAWSPSAPRQRVPSIDLAPGATAALLGGSDAPPAGHTWGAAPAASPAYAAPKTPAPRRWPTRLAWAAGGVAALLLLAELALQLGEPETSAAGASRVHAAATPPAVAPALPTAPGVAPAAGGGGARRCAATRLLRDIPIVSGVAAVGTGQGHTCALRRDGGVWCWGGNAEGQLGDGTREDRTRAVMVAIPGGARALGVGQAMTCAIDRGGSLWCWGNWYADRSDVPRRVPEVRDAVEVVVGNAHACARTATGRVYCLGSDAYGQLGLGTARGRSGGWLAADGVRALAAGANHTCALRDGGVLCWGREDEGALGIGSAGRAPHAFPTMVPGMESARAIAAGSDHTCAAMADGIVRCWGANSYGQAGGFDNSMRRLVPQAVEGVTGAVAVTAGMGHSCARTHVGAVVCWGANNNCQRGPYPQFGGPPVGALAPLGLVAEVRAGWMHTCARTLQGTLRCWGNNAEGQLGDGTTGAMPDTE
jgi:alpha-tubulin suppressor-like RCC1 family protein